MGVIICVYDLVSMEEVVKIMNGVLFCDGFYYVIENVDVVVIVIEWD